MKLSWTVTIVALLAFASLPALAEGASVGVGYTLGKAKGETGSSVDTNSISILGNYQFQKKWSVRGGVHVGEIDETGLPTADLDQVLAGLAYHFIPEGVFRPFVQGGLEYAELSAGNSDSSAGLMLGAGAEIGKGKIAGFVGITFGQMEFFNEDVDLTNFTAGALFRFGGS